MSMLENQQRFRKKSEINVNVETQYNGSTEFILITDHQTSKRKSLDKTTSEDNCCTTWARGVFRKKILYRRLPILQWMQKYTCRDAIGDLIAGFTVGLTVIPLGLAYAGVAGLPTQSGLYGAFMGCFAYVLLGTCKDNTIGSTATASLLVYQAAKGVWHRAIVLTFITAIFEILMAILKLGFLVDFVSGPVSAGFTSAVSLIVATTQVKNMLGVKNTGDTFLERWICIFNNIGDIRWRDAALGVACVTFLITFRYVGRLKIGPPEEKLRSRWQNYLNRLFWFVSVTRNATLVVACIGMATYLESQGHHYFRLAGHVPAGLPKFGLPAFSIPAQPGNATAGIEPVPGESLMETLRHLGWSLLIVPMIALLENTVVCKAFAKGKPIDATQELLAIGIGNLGNSLVGGYRANGGLARSAVNNASGVRTPMGNFYTGVVVIMALMYLSDYFYYIPKAALASVILAAIIFQLQYHVIMPMWRSKRSDLIPGFFAFIACLVLPLEIGILLAIAVNLMFILYHSARPKVSLEVLETIDGQKFLKITPDRCLVFPSVEFVRNLVLKSGTRTAHPVVIDCTYVYGADYTAAKAISSMIEDFELRQQKIIFFNLKPSVVHIFEGLNTQLLLCYNIDALNQELRPDTGKVENCSTASTLSLATHI